MDENGKLFRAMTWIDDKYVLEAETEKKHVNKKKIKYVAMAAMIACAILIMGTNSDVQATLKGGFSQTETISFTASSEAKLRDLNFSRLPENIQMKKVEMESEDFRLYCLNNENGDIIWLFQLSNYTNDGSDQELTVHAEGTITRRGSEYGTYWEIEEGSSFSIMWEQNGETLEISSAASIEEARSIYMSLVSATE